MAVKYNIAFLGQGYKGPHGASLFASDVVSAKEGLFIRPPLKQRIEQIAVHVLSSDNNFRCGSMRGAPVGAESLICNETKVVAAVQASGVSVDLIIILVNNIGTAGATSIAVIGTGIHDDSAATNALLGGTYALRLGAVVAHECGHIWTGPDHIMIPQNIMSSGCNGGGCLIDSSYLPQHQDLINAVLNAKCGPLNDATKPALTVNPIIIDPVGTVYVRADASSDTMRVELLVDGSVLKTEVFWERNGFANESTGIRFYMPKGTFAAGSHTFSVKAIDAAYNETISASQTITIT